MYGILLPVDEGGSDRMVAAELLCRIFHHHCIEADALTVRIANG